MLVPPSRALSSCGFALVVCLLASSAEAATVCHGGGCDYATITHCAYSVGNDGTCVVSPGIYYEQVGAPGSQPLMSNRVTFTCTEPRACVIDGEHVREHGIVSRGARIRGFEIRHTTGDAIVHFSGSATYVKEVSQSYLHDIGGSAIPNLAEGGLAEQNVIRDVWGDGVRCAAFTGGQVVRNNLVVSAGLGAVGARPVNCGLEDAYVWHNTVDVSRQANIGYGIVGRDVRYNVVLGGNHGVYIAGEGARAEGNVLFGYIEGPLDSASDALVETWAPLNTSGAPGLVGDDYSPVSGSVVIDAGGAIEPLLPPSDVGVPGEDVWLRTRTGLPDVGAVEHDATHVPAPSRWPVEEIVVDTGDGAMPSAAIVPGGGPAVAWIDLDEEARVSVSVRVGADDWHTELVDDALGFTSVYTPEPALDLVALAVDPVTAQPSLAWVEREGNERVVRFATRVPDGCSTSCASPHWYGCDDAPLFSTDAGAKLDVALRIDAVTGLAVFAVRRTEGSCNGAGGGASSLHVLRQQESGAWSEVLLEDAACSGADDDAFLADFDLALTADGRAAVAFTRVDATGATPVNHGLASLRYAAEDDTGAFLVEPLHMGEGVTGYQGARSFVRLAHHDAGAERYTGIALPVVVDGVRSFGFLERAEAAGAGGAWASTGRPVLHHYGDLGPIEGTAVAYGDDGLPLVAGAPSSLLALSRADARSGGAAMGWRSTIVDARRETGRFVHLLPLPNGEVALAYQHHAPTDAVLVVATADPGAVDESAYRGPDECTPQEPDAGPIQTDAGDDEDGGPLVEPDAGDDEDGGPLVEPDAGDDEDGGAATDTDAGGDADSGSNVEADAGSAPDADGGENVEPDGGALPGDDGGTSAPPDAGPGSPADAGTHPPADSGDGNEPPPVPDCDCAAGGGVGSSPPWALLGLGLLGLALLRRRPRRTSSATPERCADARSS